jgi:hypothetical protein
MQRREGLAAQSSDTRAARDSVWASRDREYGRKHGRSSGPGETADPRTGIPPEGRSGRGARREGDPDRFGSGRVRAVPRG